MKIAWVTDSTVHLDEELKGHPDVYIVPLLILFDKKEYKDGIDFTVDEFFDMLAQSPQLPTSSQPSVGTFAETYESLKDQYDAIISVHLSSKLSGTYSSSFQAAQLVDAQISVIDSKILSLPMGKLISRGMELQNQGVEYGEIVEELTRLADQHETYVTVGSLEQLHRGGRMNAAQFLIGSALKIKPILAVIDGKLESVEKVRTERKAHQKMIDLFVKAKTENPSISSISLFYGRTPDLASEWREKLQADYPDLRIQLCPLGAVIGVHAGANTFGISWYN
ncbi:DegV family protein [Bacillus pinisoli]|uniref:DegV family protein n=1 Tax=Bacillus pinisoli TaxID=2901866 RepID=UPI001FF52285|nr:DegV family protein [Bacillus pinisoli]